jgi:putative ABC transport system ATP-binding protein
VNDTATETSISTPSAWTILARLNLMIGLERRILAIIVSYAVVIGLFALIVPLTVQELVNTFAFAIQPIMIVTLVATMFGALLAMGAFRVLQARAVEILVQRLYTRLAVAFTEALPRFRENVFLPQHTNTFIEAELLPRALVAMLVDVINVSVSGTIGMAILIMYHPYFLGYNTLLITGFAFLLTFFGRGGLRITQRVSRLHYRDLSLAPGHRHQSAPFQVDGQSAAAPQKNRFAGQGLCDGAEDAFRYSERRAI